MGQPKPVTPPAFVLRPSLKLVRPFYSVAFVLAALVFFYNNNREEGRLDWLLILPALLFLWTVVRQISLRFVSLTVQGTRLRYDSGMLSKTTRTMELSRIQDVHVQQTVIQRMLNIGTLSIESAGESGRLQMANIDDPQTVAEYILDAARGR
ncbi:MAG TPA: PH domain-containing protein [Bryobacteraceae bacterium]|nr:PH domain-containing protein [Bryobacteraceae bacterium]